MNFRRKLNKTLSTSCGTFTSTSTSYTDVTNLSATITTKGNPVIIMLVNSATANGGNLGTSTTVNVSPAGYFTLLRDVSTLAIWKIIGSMASDGGTRTHYVPAGCINHYDPVAAGTYVYKVQAKANTDDNVHLNDMQLLVYELN